MGSVLDGASHQLFFSDGNRFNLEFNEDGLNGNNWNLDENANSNVACPLLMV